MDAYMTKQRSLPCRLVRKEDVGKWIIRNRGQCDLYVSHHPLKFFSDKEKNGMTQNELPQVPLCGAASLLSTVPSVFIRMILEPFSNSSTR